MKTQKNPASASKKNLFEVFENLPDKRRNQGKMHSSKVVLIIATMGIMSGCFGKDAIGDFAKRHKRELVKVFGFKKGKKRVPSSSTIWRVMKETDFEALVERFHQWTGSFVYLEDGEWISMDGKAIGGTVKNPHDAQQRYFSLVTAFTQKRKQVLAAQNVEVKKNHEIGVVQELIALLDLEGVVVSLDALHCQKETTKKIVEKKGHYVIGVKKNQKHLYERIKKTSNRELRGDNVIPKKRTGGEKKIDT